ncbi:MAG: aminotransferase class IV [Wenzhouxiangella sp.]|jgi:4-amino-4-deoxychorismate lyase|nr:aminotransferase class IV [Wenzhouxiangella sp.]
MNTLIDGQAINSVPADDRGLLFGESVFETIAFHGHQAVLWDGHMQRLKRATEAFGWDMPEEELLINECDRLLASCALAKSIIRITLTGGDGGTGYWPPPVQANRRILQLRPWPNSLALQQEQGLRCVISPFRVPFPWTYSGMKHGSRLLQTRAAAHCMARDADEALLLDHHDGFAEALSSNLILVVEGQLLTPGNVEVQGVGLAWLRNVLGANLRTGTVSFRDLSMLDEMLVINSVAGIRPVIAIEDHRLPWGPMARKLQSIWLEEALLCD